MELRLRTLNLEDNPNDTELIRAKLEQENFICDIVRVETQEDYLAALKDGQFDFIFSDYSMPGFDGMAALSIALEIAPQIPFIYVSGSIGEERAIEALKSGATDYVLKDRLERLPSVVDRALREKKVIAERKEAGQKLRESEERYRSLIESTHELVQSVAPDGRFLFVNSAWLKTLGYSRDEVSKLRLFDIIHPASHQHCQELFRRIMVGESIYNMEVTFVAKDGRHILLEGNAVPRIIDQKVIATHSFFRDITERKHAEEQIREQAALLDIDPDAISVRDMENYILFWNKGAERLYGYSKEEAIGKRATELMFLEIPTTYTQAEREVLEQGKWEGEWNHRTKDGKEVVVSSSWALVRDEQGKPKSIYVVDSDITEKKRLEAQSFRAQRIESIGTLASGIAHDLNNVLAPILLSVQALRKKMLNENATPFLDVVESATERGAAMVKQILTFARGIDGERLLIQPKHLIRELVEITRQTFPKSIKITMDLAKDLWTISGDPTQFHQVLLNLAINARDAMPRGGMLRISAENLMIDDHYAHTHLDAKKGPYVVITVADAGTGMPPEVLDKIFEPFFTTKGKGTGLGLSTSLGIVKSHGGVIDVYSEVGKGTRFKIHLPAVSSPAIQQEEKKDIEALHGKGELLLVIDDEASIREMTKSALESFGYRALTASDGNEGIALSAKRMHEIRVVICDLAMPRMDGISTIREIRKMLPSMNIVVVSGYSKDEQAVELEGIEHIRFLQKPYPVEKLLTILAEVLGKKLIQDRPSGAPQL